MTKSVRRTMLTAAAVVAAAGCTTQQEFLTQMEPVAIQNAVSRGQFELNCPSVNATVLSQEVVQPAIQGPLVSGIRRAEYTIGISGCGHRKTFVLICPEGGTGCFAAGPGPFIRE